MKRLAAHRTHYFSMTYLWFTLPILIFLNKNIPIIIICLACISSFLEQWQHHMCLKILLEWGCCFFKWENLTFMTHFFLANLLFIYFYLFIKILCISKEVFMERQKSKHEKREKKKPRNKTPQNNNNNKEMN